jgi:hypothetical protein
MIKFKAKFQALSKVYQFQPNLDFQESNKQNSTYISSKETVNRSSGFLLVDTDKNILNSNLLNGPLETLPKGDSQK